MPSGTTSGGQTLRGRRAYAALALFAAALALASGGGCTALTNPVANGVEVRQLPPELRGTTREIPPVPYDWLGQTPPADYRLGPGDVLGIWIEGVLGERGQPPPVLQPPPGVQFRPPAVGYPIPVRDDGTLQLPLVEALPVAGLTLREVEAAISRAYTVTHQIIRPGRERIIVSLHIPRQYTVLVIREDAGGITLGAGGASINVTQGGVGVGSGGNLGSKRGSGWILNLQAYENDVLHALAATGGLPGLEARNEVIVLHRQAPAQGQAPGDPLPPGLNGLACPPGFDPLQNRRVVRIPLRVPPGAELPFRPEDAILQAGDIVYIPARDNEVFYAGGLLPPGEYVLPRDYDLDVVTAVARIYNLDAGALGPNIRDLSLIGTPSPSLLTVLRRTSCGGQVVIRVNLDRALQDPSERLLIQPGDVLILQETLAESFVRYLNNVLRFNFTGTFIRQRDLTGTATLNLF